MNNFKKYFCVFGVMLSLSYLYCGRVYVENIQEELLILSDDTPLYEKATHKSNIIEKLGFLEVVKTKDNKIKNDRILIQTRQNKIGWIDINCTSRRMQDWERKETIPGLFFYSPKSYDWKIWKIIFKPDVTGSKREYKLWNNKYLIDIWIFDNRMYNEKIKSAQRKLSINNKELFYSTGYGKEDGSFYYYTVQRRKNGDVVRIVIFGAEKYSPAEKHLILKKMLFSFHDDE